MKSFMAMSWQARFTINAITFIAAVFAYCGVAPAQTGRPGASAIATAVLGVLPQVPLYWHLDTYRTRAAAQRAMGARGTVVELFGKVWLLTIAEADWRPSGGDRVAKIGPLQLGSGGSFTASYLEGTTFPGFQTDVHQHAGPEALYTVSGEVCLETPQGKMVGRAGGEPLLVAGGQPMQLTSTGTTTRRSIVLVLHGSSQPWKVPASGWSPKGLCTSS
jgi:quercetin dioxygenase-like cupin family protein